LSEFLKNKYFFNEISPSYILIPENDDFSLKNVLVLSEFLKNKNFIYGKSPSFARILEKCLNFGGKSALKEKSPKNV
jgi:hypothetical protein